MMIHPRLFLATNAVRGTLTNVLNSFTVDDEVFEDSGEARQKASLKIFEFFGDQRPLSWDINENKNNFVQFDNVNIKTRTGEICKHNVKWEIHAFPVHPILQ